MTKRNKIIYRGATIWLSLGMVSTGIVQLIKMKEEKDMLTHLGYPDYLLTILGVWKILGVIAVLSPKLPLLKEWTYAGFFLQCPVLFFLILQLVTVSKNFRPLFINNFDYNILAFQAGGKENYFS